MEVRRTAGKRVEHEGHEDHEGKARTPEEQTEVAQRTGNDCSSNSLSLCDLRELRVQRRFLVFSVTPVVNSPPKAKGAGSRASAIR